MANSWDQLRNAGAEARARLIAAAAQEWSVEPGEITIEKGVVKHPSGKSATFGALAARAQAVKLTGPVAAEGSQRVAPDRQGRAAASTPCPRPTARRSFTIDVKLPDMLTCLIAHPSRFNAKAKDLDPAAGARRAGRQGGLRRSAGRRRAGGRLLGRQEGPRRAEDRLGRDPAPRLREQPISSTRTASSPRATGAIARNDGDAEAALAGAAKVIEATYTFPYLAHAPLEPNDCVIHRTDDGGVELLFGSQLQTIDQNVAAGVLGPQAGAGEDRDAARWRQFRPARDARRATWPPRPPRFSKAAKHKGPIKVIWTREDDIKGGRYRPVFVASIEGRASTRTATSSPGTRSSSASRS